MSILGPFHCAVGVGSNWEVVQLFGRWCVPSTNTKLGTDLKFDVIVSTMNDVRRLQGDIDKFNE